MRQITIKRLLLLVGIMLAAVKVQSQGAVAFDQYFEDRTLRLDYVFAGNDKEQHIFFEHTSRRDGLGAEAVWRRCRCWAMGKSN